MACPSFVCCILLFSVALFKAWRSRHCKRFVIAEDAGNSDWSLLVRVGSSHGRRTAAGVPVVRRGGAAREPLRDLSPVQERRRPRAMTVWLEALVFIVELLDLVDAINPRVAGDSSKSRAPIPRRSWWLPERILEGSDAKPPIH